MSLPIREQILQALATRVGAVREVPIYDRSDLPLTVLAEGDEQAQPDDYDLTRVSMEVYIAKAVAANVAKEEWHGQANKEMADLIVAAFDGDDTFGGLADGMDYTGGSIDTIQDGAGGYVATISLVVRYAFLHGNPYSRVQE